MKTCDNLSVGVVIRSPEGNHALLKRAKFPIGMAPVAGHIDEHGGPEIAAINEAWEEVGLTIAPDDLVVTAIKDRRVNNTCRRTGGDHHVWTVYEAARFSGDINPDPDETKGAEWYTPEQVQAFADRTKAFLAGEINPNDWEENPGLEDVWLAFYVELGYVS